MNCYCLVCEKVTSHYIAGAGVNGEYDMEKHNTCSICDLNKAGQLKQIESKKQISFLEIGMEL